MQRDELSPLEIKAEDNKLANARAARIVAGMAGGLVVNLTPLIIQALLPEEYDSIAKFHYFSQVATALAGATIGTTVGAIVSIFTKKDSKAAFPLMGYLAGGNIAAYIALKSIDYLNTPFFTGPLHVLSP